MSVETDVVAHLIAALSGAPSFLTVANCRPGRPQETSADQTMPGAVPHRCVFVQGASGLPRVRFRDGGAYTYEERPAVNVFVRSAPNQYDDSRALAVAIRDAIDMRPPSGYHEALAARSEPDFIRTDDEHREWWLVPFTLWRAILPP